MGSHRFEITLPEPTPAPVQDVKMNTAVQPVRPATPMPRLPRSQLQANTFTPLQSYAAYASVAECREYRASLRAMPAGGKRRTPSYAQMAHIPGFRV
ncbi:unnamed protein product [Peniophora sp. CBMAI 1063]|nr:unnamed protein product [Peniophora sp. CBMAI 1063]